jgi:hypothetical protein
MTAPATSAPAASGGEQFSVTQPRRATFKNVTTNGEPIEVHFNPVSLQLSLSNTIDSSSQQNQAQYVSKSSTKLTMDLVFDTTITGTDVRRDTGQIAAFMDPQGPDQAHRAPPTVLFEWGMFKFQGIVETYRETVDFFSHEGVPLRASVNLTIAAQTIVFNRDKPPKKDAAVNVPAPRGNASQVAGAAGNPEAGRALAAANGLASMRFSTGPLTVDASVKLGAPVAFASGGVGLQAGAGFGISGGVQAGGGFGISGGVQAGAGFGISGGATLGVSAAIAGPAFGGSASAGVPATMGAFAGLRITPSLAGPPLDPVRLLPRAQPQVVTVGPKASFGIGGQAIATGSASLGTDVGTRVTAQASVRFDGG